MDRTTKKGPKAVHDIVCETKMADPTRLAPKVEDRDTSFAF